MKPQLIKEAKRLQKLAGILTEQDETPDLTPIDPDPSQIQQQKSEPADTPETPAGVISKDEAKQLIKATKGKFFTVTFIKKDGNPRVMNAKLGVKKYLKGGELPYDPEEKGLIPVYDMQKGAYRSVNVSTITNLKIGNKEYQVQ
jgi:hypothetical protein